jgi:hypothetical protein
MQTLIFDTSKKTIRLLDGSRGNSKEIETFERIKTVKVLVGCYEAIQIPPDPHLNPTPVLRVPISNTNMIIINE